MKTKIKYLIIPAAIILFSSCVSNSHIAGNNKNDRMGSNNTALTVMTYNVHHCNPPSKAKEGVIDIDAIVKVIQAQNPDLVALQEIDDRTERSGKDINEAEVIAKKLKMYYYFGKAIDYAGGGYGTAILSKYPISEEERYFLPKQANEAMEQRILITVRIKLPGEKYLRFGCTHLDAGNAKNRELQAIAINHVAKNDSLPFILGGDFNDVIGSKTIQTLDEVFLRSCDVCEPTIPQDKPKSTIDFILFDKKHPFGISSYKVIAETYASDHRPVVAVVTLP